jgi:hypothetical protein
MQSRWSIVHATSQRSFQFVEEDNEFLSLFPHRYDFIWAAHTAANAKVEWQTETRYPLSDRIIQQGSSLYGVRFGSQTQYFLLDIDINSPYHPNQDPFAIPSIVAAVEPLGSVRYIGCISSYSGGLHLYFPFQQIQDSWKIAIALTTLLENAGFKLYPGHLELFPNPKPYSTEPSLFNAHRLPLQIGSYLVNQDFQPIWSSHDRFVEQWKFAQARNDLDADVLKRILKQLKRPPFQFSGKADKFLSDLNAEIEAGWTDYGQTNRLLGRIAMRTYIFHHVLFGGKPLAGQALIDEIVAVARALPGYSEWCRHQHEIKHRAAEWARCIENSRYFHYGERAKKPNVETPSPWNQQQLENARIRIRDAIADLIEQDILATGATARFQQLLQFGIGGSTLYRHRDLWHPAHLTDLPQTPSSFKSNCPLDCNGGASNGHCPTSLFPMDGSNATQGNSSSNLEEFNSEDSGRNASESTTIDPTQIHALIQATRLRLQAEQVARQQATELIKQQQEQQKNELAQARQINRMQQFLNSGDSILIAEAMTWAQAHPNILDLRQWILMFDSSTQIKHEHLRCAIAHLLHQLNLDPLNEFELDHAALHTLLMDLKERFLDSS